MPQRTVSERVGIERIRASVRGRPGTELGIGDDAAILALGARVLACHDILVEGVHFRRATSTLADVGHKAIAVNLSDIAAMGGVPGAVLVGLTVPTEGITPDELDELYASMDSVAGAHAVTIAGGDTTVGPALSVAVTMLGALPPGAPPLTRAGAQLGDVLCVTGALGAAAAGLALLEGTVDASLTPHADALIDAQRRPVARLVEGRVLARSGARAGMDVSDGLVLDAARLCDEGGRGAIIRLESVPRAPGVDAVAEALGVAPDILAATGGEDYELLAAIPPELVAAIGARLPRPLVPVGVVTAAPGVRLERDGEPVHVPHAGWERP